MLRAAGLERLLQVVLAMSRGVVGDDSDDRIAEPLIQRRRLEAVRIEQCLGAAPPDGLLLSRRQQPRAEALAAQVFAHPQQLYLQDASPGKSGDPRGDFRFIPNDDRQAASIITSRQGSVVLVDPVFQEPDVLLIRTIVNREWRIERYSTPPCRDDQIVRALVSSGKRFRRLKAFVRSSL